MATTTVSIGSRSDTVDTETPASSSGSGPLYTVTFGTTPTGIAVGHIGTVDAYSWDDGNTSVYVYVVTAISGDNITLKYLRDSRDRGDASPYGLHSTGGSSGSTVQQSMVFKRHGLPTAHNTDDDPSFVITFNDAGPPADLHVGDIAKVDDGEGSGMMMGTPADYEYLVTAIDLSAKTVTMKYVYDSGSAGSTSPYGLTDTNGDQVLIEFHRAFSTITLFEEMIDDSSPNYWGSSDDVVGELHADSNFTDNTVTFDQKQSLSSVTLSVYSDDRHDGTAESGALWKPTTGSGHDVGIIRINIDNMIVEWLDISLHELDGTNTNKVIVFVGTNDDNIIRNNIFHDKDGDPGNNGCFCIHVLAAGASSDVISIFNNIVYRWENTDSGEASSGINMNAWSGTVNIYNNTVYYVDSQANSKNAIGYRFNGNSNQTANVKNNISHTVFANRTAYSRAFFDNGTGTSNVDYNLSTGDSHPTYDAQGANSIINVSTNNSTTPFFVSVAEGSEDLHLHASSPALEEGYDLGTTNGVNIDIDGIDRDATGVTWDMGADQTSVASATTNAPFIMFVD